MAVMRKISEAYSVEDQDVYCCLACKAHTCEPRRFCNNCGQKITAIFDELMEKTNCTKQDKKARRKVYETPRNGVPTNFYILHTFKNEGQWKIYRRFYDEYSFRGSFSNRLYKTLQDSEILKEEPCSFSIRKLVRLTEAEASNYEIYGEDVGISHTVAWRV